MQVAGQLCRAQAALQISRVQSSDMNIRLPGFRTDLPVGLPCQAAWHFLPFRQAQCNITELYFVVGQIEQHMGIFQRYAVLIQRACHRITDGDMAGELLCLLLCQLAAETQIGFGQIRRKHIGIQSAHHQIGFQQR